MEILQTVPASAKFFAKMDAVNGYFQIALDEESSLKTTFLLQAEGTDTSAFPKASMRPPTNGVEGRTPS